MGKAPRWILIKQETFPNAFSIRPENNINMCLTYSEFKNAALVLPINQNLATQYWGISHYDTLYSILDVEKELDIDRLEQKIGQKANLVKRSYGNFSEESISNVDLDYESIDKQASEIEKQTVISAVSKATSRPVKNRDPSITSIEAFDDTYEKAIAKSLKETEDLINRISVKQKSKVFIPKTNQEFFAEDVDVRGRTATVTILKNRSRSNSLTESRRVVRSRSRSRSRSSSPSLMPSLSPNQKFKSQKRREKILKQKLTELQNNLDQEAQNWIKAYEKVSGVKYKDDIRHLNKIEKSLAVEEKLNFEYPGTFRKKSAPKVPARKPRAKPRSKSNDRIAHRERSKTPTIVSFSHNLPSYSKNKNTASYSVANHVQATQPEKLNSKIPSQDQNRGPPVSQGARVIWVDNKLKKQLYKDIKSNKRINYDFGERFDLDEEKVGVTPNLNEQPREVFKVYL